MQMTLFQRDTIEKHRNSITRKNLSLPGALERSPPAEKLKKLIQKFPAAAACPAAGGAAVALAAETICCSCLAKCKLCCSRGCCC